MSLPSKEGAAHPTVGWNVGLPLRMIQTEQSTEFSRGFEDAIVANGHMDNFDDDWRHLASLASLCSGDRTSRCFVREEY
jgi:hypothetical protein